MNDQELYDHKILNIAIDLYIDAGLCALPDKEVIDVANKLIELVKGSHGFETLNT